MEDNRVTDTSQTANPNNAENAFEAPATPESSENTNLTVEDAFFGASETQPQDTPPSQEQAPQAQEKPATQTEYQAKNDEKRFEYWQSQAAQRENEISQLKAQLENNQVQPPPQQTQGQVPQQQQVEEFPPPPEKPKKPHGFSREDAWGDPSSESARYLDEVESWQDDVTSYNELKHQYEIAMMQERFDKIEDEKQAAMKQREAYNQQQRQISEINQYVQGHHGLSDAEAQEFIQTMSNPDSISMDNLVALYRMQKGLPGTQAPQGEGPSETFVQTQQAQQIPSPMGVVTGNTGNNTRSEGDQIMDSLIGDYNSNNPWK
jgi:hypothetical protein